MLYKVKATFIEDKLAEFRAKLTDGSIEHQKPDGAEIVASMKRAVITGPGTIEWYETCYCPTPLQHERESVYDKYLEGISTELVETEGTVHGKSFWPYVMSI